MNAAVHAAMYLFYAFPRHMRHCKTAITLFQIAQHGLVVTGILTALSAPAEMHCDAPLRVYLPSLCLYAMWLVEFVALLVSRYQ